MLKPYDKEEHVMIPYLRAACAEMLEKYPKNAVIDTPGLCSKLRHTYNLPLWWSYYLPQLVSLWYLDEKWCMTEARIAKLLEIIAAIDAGELDNHGDMCFLTDKENE